MALAGDGFAFRSLISHWSVPTNALGRQPWSNTDELLYHASVQLEPSVGALHAGFAYLGPTHRWIRRTVCPYTSSSISLANGPKPFSSHSGHGADEFSSESGYASVGRAGKDDGNPKQGVAVRADEAVVARASTAVGCLAALATAEHHYGYQSC